MEPLVVIERNSKAYGDTYLNSEKFSYTWTIHNFSHTTFRSDGSHLKSPTFQTLHNDSTISWYLHLVRQAKSNTTGNDMYFAAFGKVSKECKISAKFEFSLMNKNIEESIKFNGTINGELYQPVHVFNVPCTNNYFTSSLLIAKYSGFLPKDKLTIVCDITIATDQLSVTSNERGSNQQVPKCQLVDDIGALFGDRNFCDVKLMVNGKNFHAHKNILAARSSVFAAMFRHEMAEKINNTVKITDIDHEVFEEVLRYIYMGETSSLTDETAIELLIAADKYELNRLKIICEVFMGKNLTKDNVTDILIVADAHCSTLLKTQALEFINTHIKDVQDTNGYKSMRKSHPQLIEECYNALAKKLEQIGIK